MCPGQAHRNHAVVAKHRIADAIATIQVITVLSVREPWGRCVLTSVGVKTPGKLTILGLCNLLVHVIDRRAEARKDRPAKS